MTYILIHNPGCGSSKKGLELLKANGIEPQIRKYMSAAERLSVEELKDIAKKMGAKSPRAFKIAAPFLIADALHRLIVKADALPQ